MDFLPKNGKSLGRTAPPSASNTWSSKLLSRFFGRQANLLPGADSNRIAPSPTFDAGRISNTANSGLAWLIFAPTAFLITALIAAFQVRELDWKQCAMTIGLILMFHNAGALTQKMVDRFFQDMSRGIRSVRGGAPVLFLAGFLAWLHLPRESDFYNHWIELNVVAVVLAFGSHICTKWLTGPSGRTWLVGIRIACCVYLAILYIGGFVINTPGVIVSSDVLLLSIGAVAFVLHMLTDEITMLPIQLLSVSYTYVLWGSRADPVLMANTVSVMLMLLVLLLSTAICVRGFWRTVRR